MRVFSAVIFFGLSTPVWADTVTVYAAASLGPALDQVAADWGDQTGNSVVIVYGGSGALAQQILNGAPADIFWSASTEWMDAVAEAGLIDGPSRADLLGNDLVLVAHDPAQAPVTITDDLDLVGLLNGGKLAMGLVESVPAGQYGKAALTYFGLWDVAQGQVAEADNVRAALTLVAQGEAPFGIVYASDATAEPLVHVVAVFPPESHPPILYPAALIAGAGPAGSAFMAALQTPASLQVFADQGFLMSGNRP